MERGKSPDWIWGCRKHAFDVHPLRLLPQTERYFFCRIQLADEESSTNNSTNTTSSNDPLPTSNGGPYTGDLTYYDPGLGSCGITSTSSEKICAVSHVVFDAALTSGNPNENPLCGLRLRIRRGDRSVDVKVVDRCPGCNVDDLDVSSSVFEELGDLAEGRVTVEWAWLDKTPVAMG